MTENQTLAASLTTTGKPGRWWIHGMDDGPIGPYDKRAEADEDRQGIQRFMRSLREAADEEAIRELVVERAELVRRLESCDSGRVGSAGKPLSRDQIRFEETFDDADSFVKAIT